MPQIRKVTKIYDTGMESDLPFNPADWRNHPDPDGDEDFEDEERPTPQYVIDLLGFVPGEKK